MSWLDSPARLARSWSTSMWVRSASLPQSSRILMASGEDFRIVLSFSAWERSTPASSPSTRMEIGIVTEPHAGRRGCGEGAELLSYRLPEELERLEPVGSFDRVDAAAVLQSAVQ